MITSAMMVASGRGSMIAATAAPQKPNTTALAQTGTEMRQSMLPRLWYRKLPRMPVKRNVNSEVAAAWWILSPPNSARKHTISTPPTPTVPISRPTNVATAARRMSELSRPSTGLSLADHLLELGELVFLHEDSVLGAGIAAGAHVVAVVAEAFLDDRHEVDVDLRVPRHVRLVEVEQVRADDVHAVGAVARAERDHRHRQRLREVLAHLGGCHLAHDREAAGVDHRPGVVDQLLRPVRGLALGEEAAELRHAHRGDADVALHRDAGLDDRLDVLGVVLITFALHYLGAALRDVLCGVVHGLLRREVEAHVGHVDHAQAVLRAALHRLRHEHHFLERHRGRALVAEQHHAAGVRHAQDVDADAVGDDRGLVVVHRELDDGLAFLHLFHQHGNRHLLARWLLRGGLLLGHDSVSSVQYVEMLKALRSRARSSIGMHNAAAMTDRAIAASHTGR